MSTLTQNLRKERNRHQLTQTKAAQRIGIARHNLQAYEEGRAEPPLAIMLQIAEAYHITDLPGFISDPNYTHDKTPVQPTTIVEGAYRKLKGREKIAVDVLLGID